MSRFLKSLGRLLPIGKNKPVGYDLAGNRFYEIPSLISERPRRTVEYKIHKEPNEYVVGERLPVQWSAWLSHTRVDPPSLEELQRDVDRRTRLAHNVAQIEARDAAELEQRRLRQISAPSSSASGSTSSSSSPTALPISSSIAHEIQDGGANALKGSVEATRGWLQRQSQTEQEARKVQDQHGLDDSTPLVSTATTDAMRDAKDPNAPVSPTLRMLAQQKTEQDRQRLLAASGQVGGESQNAESLQASRERHTTPGSGSGLLDAFVPLPAARAGQAGRPALSSSTPGSALTSTQRSQSQGSSSGGGSGFAKPGQGVVPDGSGTGAPQQSTVQPRARRSAGYGGPLYTQGDASGSKVASAQVNKSGLKPEEGRTAKGMSGVVKQGKTDQQGPLYGKK